MENNKNNENMKEISKNNKVYFAYIRKSTQGTKKQRMSLYEQRSEISMIIAQKGIKKEDVIFYEESRSAFAEGKPRPQMDAMMKSIDECAKQGKDVYLITLDPSRLARNRNIDSFFTDGVHPKDYTKKSKIQAIYMQAGDWTRETSRQDMISSFNSAEMYSEALREKTIFRNKGFLETGRWRHSRTPEGFKNIAQTDGILEVDENKMPHIIEAFRMKSKNSNNQDICDYLSLWGIKKRPDRLINIFQNSVYIGYHTDKLGEVYELKFKGGKPPMDEKLFYAVQDIINAPKRGKNYKPPRERDIFEIIGRTDEGLFLTKEIKKKKSGLEFVYYRNTKRKGYNISKVFLVKEYMKYYSEFIVRIWNIIRMCKIEELKKNYREMIKECGYSEKYVLVMQTWIQMMIKNYTSVIPMHEMAYKISLRTYEDANKKSEFLDENYIKELFEDKEKAFAEYKKIKEKVERFEYLQDASREEIFQEFLEFEIDIMDRYIDTCENMKLFPQPNIMNYKNIFEINEEIEGDKEVDYNDVKEFMNIAMKENPFDRMVFKLATINTDAVFRDIFKCFKDDFSDMEGEKILTILKDAISEINPEQEKVQKIKIESVQKIKNQIQEKKMALKTAKIELMRKGFTSSDVEEYIQEENKEIQRLEAELGNIETNDDFSRFLNELPNLLYKTLELTRNIDSNAENEEIEGILTQLIKFTGSNYILGKEKSLNIGINPVLELLFLDDKNQWWTCRGSNPGPSP